VGVGDLIQLKNHNWGEQHTIGLVMEHRLSSRGYNVWGVLLNDQEELQYYMTHDLSVINASR
jgi:hypothetical protein